MIINRGWLSDLSRHTSGAPPPSSHDHEGRAVSRNGGGGFGVARSVRSGKGPLVAPALAALLAVGCAAAARPEHQAGGGGVPWVNRTAPLYVLRLQLAGRPGRGGPAAGTVYREVRLINCGDRPLVYSMRTS